MMLTPHAVGKFRNPGAGWGFHLLSPGTNGGLLGNPVDDATGMAVAETPGFGCGPLSGPVCRICRRFRLVMSSGMRRHTRESAV